MLAVLSWPILERIPIVGDLAISPHGIGTAVGFLTGAVLMIRRAELRGISHSYVDDIRREVQDLLFWAAIGTLIGVRLFFVLTHLDLYADDPISVLYLWEGGLTLIGGIFGAMAVAVPIAWKRGYRASQLLDSAAPGLAVGIFIGRIGDLVIGDHIADPAPGFPLAWRCTGNFWDEATNSLRLTDRIPPEVYPFGVVDAPTQGCFDAALHQTAFYDFIQAGLLLAVLLLLERRPRWDGFFITVWLYWYAAGRFVMDFLREDRRLFGLTGSQYAGIAAILALTAFLAWRKPWQARPRAWDPPDFDHPWHRPPEPGPEGSDRETGAEAEAGGTDRETRAEAEAGGTDRETGAEAEAGGTDREAGPQG